MERNVRWAGQSHGTHATGLVARRQITHVHDGIPDHVWKRKGQSEAAITIDMARPRRDKRGGRNSAERTLV